MRRARAGLRPACTSCFAARPHRQHRRTAAAPRFVDQGLVPGWDDPRFPTVQGIVRRGLTVEALREFILLQARGGALRAAAVCCSTRPVCVPQAVLPRPGATTQGASRNMNTMTWDKLWTMNKKLIDPVCPRHTAVARDARVKVVFSNGPAVPEVSIIPKHKKCPAAGDKALTRTATVWIDLVDAEAIAEGEEVAFLFAKGTQTAFSALPWLASSCAVGVGPSPQRRPSPARR